MTSTLLYKYFRRHTTRVRLLEVQAHRLIGWFHWSIDLIDWFSHLHLQADSNPAHMVTQQDNNAENKEAETHIKYILGVYGYILPFPKTSAGVHINIPTRRNGGKTFFFFLWCLRRNQGGKSPLIGLPHFLPRQCCYVIYFCSVCRSIVSTNRPVAS